jgi:5-(carboxyamino)imidazole ribonucleotide mutase
MNYLQCFGKFRVSVIDFSRVFRFFRACPPLEGNSCLFFLCGLCGLFRILREIPARGGQAYFEKGKYMPAKVAVVMGSTSDQEVMQPALDTLDELGISYEMMVLSAHRTPDKTRSFARGAKEKGYKVIIAGAGGSAALPGFVSSYTDLPVIGVPIASTSLGGLDALLSMVQMPSGVPVAAVAIGKAGAKNAAHLASRILGG